jgi:hypothetical protein
MIYEFRTYEVTPGKIESLKKRFQTMSIPLFEKHGIKVIGFWETGTVPKDAKVSKNEYGIIVETSGTVFQGNELTYMVAFESLQERDRKWNEFRDDPEWHRLRKQSEADGVKMVISESTKILRPTEFSPLQ